MLGTRDAIICEMFPPFFRYNIYDASGDEVEKARRIVMLSEEMDKGMETWQQKQEEMKRMEEHQKSLLLKPKGRLLRKKA
ncbi:hypothetical protein CRUP_005178 [Coryphaenoides rupestris]|nr:hypothetical protein CRUP_005178 [Coryphaenoides rupestris]